MTWIVTSRTANCEAIAVKNCTRWLFVWLSPLISELFVEKIPQVHLMLLLIFFNWDDKSWVYVYWWGFVFSFFSASFGMTKLLMNGPSKIIKKQGHLGGYLQLGFFLLFLCNIDVLVAKALGLAFLASNPFSVLVWMAVSLLPQCILVSTYY